MKNRSIHLISVRPNLSEQTLKFEAQKSLRLRLKMWFGHFDQTMMRAKHHRSQSFKDDCQVPSDLDECVAIGEEAEEARQSQNEVRRNESSPHPRAALSRATGAPTVDRPGGRKATLLFRSVTPATWRVASLNPREKRAAVRNAIVYGMVGTPLQSVKFCNLALRHRPELVGVIGTPARSRTRCARAEGHFPAAPGRTTGCPIWAYPRIADYTEK